jgi:hypothetical protein
MRTLRRRRRCRRPLRPQCPILFRRFGLTAKQSISVCKLLAQEI